MAKSPPEPAISKWVTGTDARELVQQMRRETDAVMVGIKTVLADDPALTARDSAGRPLARQPLRVALDSHCRMPAQSQLLHQPGQTLVYTTAAAPSRNVRGAGRDREPRCSRWAPLLSAKSARRKYWRTWDVAG